MSLHLTEGVSTQDAVRRTSSGLDFEEELQAQVRICKTVTSQGNRDLTEAFGIFFIATSYHDSL